MKQNPAIVTDEHFQVTPTKDVGYSGFSTHDYVVNGEITVTITLNEYRSLVAAASKAEANDAVMKRYAAERERDEIKKELAEAHKRIVDLQAKVADLTVKKED